MFPEGWLNMKVWIKRAKKAITNSSPAANRQSRLLTGKARYGTRVQQKPVNNALGAGNSLIQPMLHQIEEWEKQLESMPADIQKQMREIISDAVSALRRVR